MSEKVRVHIVVLGRVQGVFFRQGVQGKAQGLGITGWVKNLPAGEVEAIFEGDKEKIETLLNWAKKGPFFARVDKLNAEWQNYKGEFDRFEIRY